MLVGLPGSGKSTVGRLLAAKLGRSFLDFDTEIERREGSSITRVFQERGEAAFRALERALSIELSGHEGMVLAPGGGWVTDSGAVAALRPTSVVVYLQVRPETALARLGPAARDRPLLAGPDARKTLAELLEQRREAYASADAVVDAEVVTPQRVMDGVLATLRRLGRL